MAAVRAIGLVGPDARRGAARRARRGAAPGDPVERRPQRRAVRGARGGACRALHAIAGNLAMPGFTAPKLLWVREHEPRAVRTHGARAAAQGLAAPAAHRRDASATCPTPRARCGSTSARAAGRTKLLAACGLTRDHMPRLVEGSEVVGPAATPSWPTRWGLRGRHRGGRRRRRQRGQRGRHRRGAAGPGLRLAGHLGRDLRRQRPLPPDPDSAVHAFCHALPGRWHQMSVMLSAASALRWARELLGLPSEAALLERVARADTGAARAGAAVPALPERRAHAAQRSECPGRAVRPDARARRGRRSPTR